MGPVDAYDVLSVRADFDHSPCCVPTTGVVGVLVLDSDMVTNAKGLKGSARGVMTADEGCVTSGKGSLTLLC